MAITYNWDIVQMDCAPSENGLSKVIKTVHWQVEASEGDLNARSYGAVGLSSPNPDSFIAFDELDKGQAITWLKAALDASMPDQEKTCCEIIEAGLALDIENQKNPPIVSPALPWA